MSDVPNYLGIQHYYIDNNGFIHQESGPNRFLCDGRELDTTENPELFARIGYAYTHKSNRNKGKFNIPDLHSRMLNPTPGNPK